MAESYDVHRMVAEVNASVAKSSREADRFTKARAALWGGGIILSLAAAWAIEVALFARTAMPVTGHVISTKHDESWWGKRKTVRTVSYSFEGTSNELTTRERGLRNEVDLLVSPRRPTDARIAGSLWMWPLYLTIVGGVALGLGAARWKAAQRDDGDTAD